MTDVITIISNNWDKTNTDNIVPKMFHEAPESPHSSRNYNRCISFKLTEDDIDDLGIDRSHQDVESKDMFEIKICDFTKALCMKFVKEFRRICRIKGLLHGDDEYTWFDWQGGSYIPNSYRKEFQMLLFAFRAGVSFET